MGLRRLSFGDEDSFKESEAAGSLRFNNPPSDTDGTLALQQPGSSSSLPLQERNASEDICFNNPPSDPNLNTTIRQLGVGNSSSSSTLPQERSEITYIMVS